MEVNQIIQGDCLEKLKDIPDNFVDAIVTDPPAGIGFMGKEWDSDKGGREEWITWLTKVMSEGLRVLKPGGHALVWALPRTSHWTGTALENAGFEVRDCVYHLFGSGFPKSLDISKAIDKQDTTDFRKEVGRVIREAREQKGLTMDKLCDVLRLNNEGHGGMVNHYENGRATPTIELWEQMVKVLDIKKIENYTNEKKGRLQEVGKIENPISWFGEGLKKEATTPEAKQWEGWGTALKPAVECWWLVRKPLGEKTVAENVLKHGTGGLNIDECRIGTDEMGGGTMPDLRDVGRISKETTGIDKLSFGQATGAKRKEYENYKIGRFPSHLIHDGSEVILKELNDEARFFYTAKPSSSEKNLMYGEFEKKPSASSEFRPNHTEKAANGEPGNPYGRWKKLLNNHPTVKAQALMQYLIKLITPPKGIVLDMFAGSGSTLLAAKTLGHPYIGIEIDPDYCKIAEARMGQQVLNF